MARTPPLNLIPVFCLISWSLSIQLPYQELPDQLIFINSIPVFCLISLSLSIQFPYSALSADLYQFNYRIKNSLISWSLSIQFPYSALSAYLYQFNSRILPYQLIFINKIHGFYFDKNQQKPICSIEFFNFAPCWSMFFWRYVPLTCVPYSLYNSTQYNK